MFTRRRNTIFNYPYLGTLQDVNRLDGVTFQGHEKFYLHYNFPPFSTGGNRPLRGTSRREIGHGNLAQKLKEDDSYR